ncbi:hypothetical protein [Acetobacter ghanensis]|uniref:DUF4412 domain-containing protein n=1 Tax=Acetobacter ghanensis TaxID=431306 RepID=A0A0U5F2J1_9PROT|nr:hypothetical protein [Acetobacter ghanensis]NHO38486.1 hypothetical protein [Acetobacter ghanensis]GBQ46815.1 hypothetical protein AA18895_0879 [Acetobacter ghanensis DSM 18895]CEF55332.1 hypothetical protein AGA_1365 [Acetobacter ghanensis]
MVVWSRVLQQSGLLAAVLGLVSVNVLGGTAQAEQTETPAVQGSAQTPADGTPAEAPAITPSTDVDVEYELASPQGDVSTRQRMRWQVATLRQRLDPDKSSVFMITSWRDRTLSVVDMGRKRVSIMPVPGTQQLTPPGQPAMVGSYARLGSSVVASEQCTVWRTKDTDGHQTDACYTADGLLLQVAQGGQITVRALSVQRTPQPDSLFVIPDGLKREAPAHP